MKKDSIQPWGDAIYALFKSHRVNMLSFVPDAGHARLIALCERDAEMRAVTLTTEEEGIAFAAGAYLGGERAVLLMQSSGVGNCMNMLSLPRVCNMPLVMLITMRGEWGEFNPWQVPMGQQTRALLEQCGVIVYRVESLPDVTPTIDAAMQFAFASRQRVAILLAQKMIGAKNFQATHESANNANNTSLSFRTE